jgi:hypothetical protein
VRQACTESHLRKARCRGSFHNFSTLWQCLLTKSCLQDWVNNAAALLRGIERSKCGGMKSALWTCKERQGRHHAPQQRQPLNFVAAVQMAVQSLDCAGAR